ncbi:unnamed protein product, partial [Polarella glacialis]
LIKKENHVQVRNVLEEVGPEGIRRLQLGQSDSVKALLMHRSMSESMLQKVAAERSSPSLPRGDSLQNAAAHLLKRQRKVQAAVQGHIEQETQALKEQIREEAQERRRLLSELRQRRALQKAVQLCSRD